MAATPWTRRMVLHMKGGIPEKAEECFSYLSYELLYAGEPTGITEHEGTTGAPDYKIVMDYLQHGLDRFDVLAAPVAPNGRVTGMLDWLEAQRRQAVTVNPTSPTTEQEASD
jgi:hypothetical protein